MLALKEQNDSSRAGLNSSPGRSHSPIKRLQAFTLYISSAAQLWTASAASHPSCSFLSPLKNDSDTVHLLCWPCVNSLANLGVVLCRWRAALGWSCADTGQLELCSIKG